MKPGWQFARLQATCGCLAGHISVSIHNSAFAPQVWCYSLSVFVMGTGRGGGGRGFQSKSETNFEVKSFFVFHYSNGRQIEGLVYTGHQPTSMRNPAALTQIARDPNTKGTTRSNQMWIWRIVGHPSACTMPSCKQPAQYPPTPFQSPLA
eukprot:1146117-Pelagomonas_calceolata.AAC.1